MHRIDMDKSYVIGIDIGSSNVVMAAGTLNENGEMSVLAVDVQEIEDCVKDGDITNYINLGTAIARGKEALEKELGRTINSAYVGVSGRSVYSVRYEDYVDINEKTGCVTENEMRELHSRIEMVISANGDEIIERIPLRYQIDDRQKVKNPIGACGRKLSATYLFVMVDKQQVDRVNKALYRSGIKACGLCVIPTILPRTLLSQSESEGGVAIVDIGSDLTDITIVSEGKVWYFASLPIGASSLNNDLYEFLRISKREVETIKRKYGAAVADGVPEDLSIPIKTIGQSKKQVLKRNIAEIIEERLKDIAGFVSRELKAAKFSTKLPFGVVLTGGASYLTNMEMLFSRELNMEVRLGEMFNGVDDESQMRVSHPEAAAVSLLLYGAEHEHCETAPMIGGTAPTVEPPRPTPVPTPTPQPIPMPIPTPQPVAPVEPPTPIEPVVEEPKEEPKVEIPTVTVEEQKPIEQEAEAPATDEPATDVEESEEKPQKEEPRESAKRPTRRGLGGRFIEWVDGLFSNDNDFI